KHIAQIAKSWKPIKLKTTSIFLTPGGFVMLGIDMTKQSSGQNHRIQQLSDKLISQLSKLRDFKASIPAWAESIPAKRKAFISYGSPNVFFEFDPHLS